MLTRYFHDPITLAAVQALIAGSLAFFVVFLSYKLQLRMERDISIALVRGLIQVVIVGMVLLLIFQEPVAIGFVILAAMMIAAAQTSAKRARGLPDAFRVSLYSIVIGSGSVLLVAVAIGVIELKLSALIPVGSMLLANGMNTASLAFNRFRGEVLAHVGHIDAALSLGASPRAAVMPYIRAAILASLIPRVDSLRSLGIVWIPVLMTGMLLGGSHPVRAALYQFVIMSMILTVSALTSILAVLLMSRRIFTPAEQLILRGGQE